MTRSCDERVDAIVVGAGPNGLAAAITLARAGRSVRVYEAAATPGGGTRTAELTLPGFRHDVCSTILPLALASPFFRGIDLAARGVEFVHPDAPVAHPLDGGRAAVIERSVTATAEGLGVADGRAWRRLFGPLVRDADALASELLRPVVRLPRHPLALTRFGLPALRSARGLAQGRFRDEPARALFAGVAAHSMLRLDRPLSASFGLVLATYAQAVGWPMVLGGSSAIADALVAKLESLGGEVVTGRRVASLEELPAARSVLLDVTPRQLIAIAGDRLSPRTRRRAERFRYGPGVSSSTGHSTGRSRGPPRGRAGRRRSIWGARLTRSPRPRRTSRPADTPTGHTSSSSSTRHGIRRARRPGRRPPGHTATCPRAPRWT